MNYERLEQCPLCGKEEFKNFMVVKDNSVSQESFVIVQCTYCDLKFTNPRPDEQSIGRYYESEAYISHSNSTSGITSKAYQLVRNYTLKQKVEIINKYQPHGKILDYGCGTGNFLAACQQDGWEIAGVEPNDRARTQAQTLLNKVIQANQLDAFPSESFAVITLWHVLEHIHALHETLKQLTKLLQAGGTILIAVPNADSHDAQTYKQNWAAYDVPRHLYHFNQATMKRLLKKHKLDLVAILPMKFDAYYVSLLSEKYKNGSTEILKSMLHGYQSNQYASKNASEYSSLIYVGKHK